MKNIYIKFVSKLTNVWFAYGPANINEEEYFMKVLGLSAGTLNGANDSLCKEALMAAQEAGAEIEFINVTQLDIKFSGRGNGCVLKDDLQWLIDKMFDADGIIWAAPIFEKCAPGLFHTIMDRFGPRMDRGNLMIATKIAEEHGGKPIDPKYLKEKVVTFEESLRGKLLQASRRAAPAKAMRQALEGSSARVTEQDVQTRMDDNGVNVTAQAAEAIRNAYQMRYVMSSLNTDLAILNAAIRGQ